ncbi:MAG: acetolactate synthase small subunit [Thermomicrobiales bacterium]|nr:acetolactate synthase small subunit [Thermomicrobiales bacterium]MCO5219937.1 acetolactate synthase small subunit [Thermomicrobiales bacterium]MCO5226237.1 acetolactate synthase small subunit [Thermomicrobiales bacterium]MCO5227572.1 acetolactate synthase small subunit [Thermomicrobiales bacterium]
MESTHTLVLLVEDHPGVLNRVVSLMRRRSFNIDSITVGHSEQVGVSRMTIQLRGNSEDIEQAGKQLYKLLEVVKVIDLQPNEAMIRELVLVKVAAKGAVRAEVVQTASIYGARVLDATPSSVMIEMSGGEEEIESFLTMMRIYGIREMVRSGKVALPRVLSKKTDRQTRQMNPLAAD